jgi:hypothetical protein
MMLKNLKRNPTISQERIINDTLIEFLPSSLYAYKLGKNIYNDAEKFKVQSINDFLIFVTQAIASLSAGWFVFNFGWEVVLLSTIPLLLLQLLLLLWWLRKKSH